MEDKHREENEHAGEGQNTRENNMENNFETETDNRADEVLENREITGEVSETEQLQAQLNELKDKYLRQVADFDNYRKRTARERLDLIQTAGKNVIESLLTVLDDCSRAEEQMKKLDAPPALTEGTVLIFNKLRNILQSKGLKRMESVGNEFNPEFHEAITEVPAPSPEMAGKVIDEVECGYYLNDKIIRFAKVIVGK